MSQEAQQAGIAGKLSAGTNVLRQRWSAMQAAQRRLLVLSVVAFVALAGISSWWSSRTDWRTLFSGLDARDAAQVQQQLSSAGLVYQTTPDGTAIQVAAENLDKARVAIAAKGMPQSGRLGFELFDKPNWVGSEFDEKVNFQRALEGELEHTIETMDAVRSARVHIVLPKQGAFSSEDQPAKASVILKLKHSAVPREEADSIRNMVASAVEGLQPGSVTLTDADGRVNLSSPTTQASEHQEEASLEQKLIAVLEPLAGAGNVHATVNISYQQGTEERTDDVYDPSGAVPVSTQKTEQTAQTTKASGAAGTVSNAPVATPVQNTPTNGTTPAAAAAATTLPGPTGQTQVSREESSSFAVSHHVSHMEEGPGRVRRVAAAIVINDREITDLSGKQAKTMWKPRSADEMHRMEQLAQAAVGFESKRGDEVVLQNIAFSSNVQLAPPALMDRVGTSARDLLRSQPSLLRTLGMGACLLILGFAVLRPLGKQATRLLEPPAPMMALAGSTPAQIEAGDEQTDSQTSGERRAFNAPNPAQSIFDQVSSQIHAQPQGSTRLLESWIAGPEAD